MARPTPEERQQAIDFLAQQLAASGEGTPEEARQAATAVIDKAIAAQKDGD